MEIQNAIYWRTLKRDGWQSTWALTEEHNGYIYFSYETDKGHDTGWEFQRWFGDREEALEWVVGCVLTARKDGWVEL